MAFASAWPIIEGTSDCVRAYQQANSRPKAVAETNCQGLRCTMPKSTDDNKKAAAGLNRRRNARRIKPRNITSSVTGATITRRKNEAQPCFETEDTSLKRRTIHSGAG